MNTKTFSPTVSVLNQEFGVCMLTNMKLVDLFEIWQKFISLKKEGTKIQEYYHSKLSLVIWL
jgi:hypothetical protein